MTWASDYQESRSCWYGTVPTVARQASSCSLEPGVTAGDIFVLTKVDSGSGTSYGSRKTWRLPGHDCDDTRDQPVPERPDAMKLALDPQMFFATSSVYDLPDIVARCGFDWMELSPKADFIPFFRYPRVDDAGVRRLEEGRRGCRSGDRLGAAGAALVRSG